MDPLGYSTLVRKATDGTFTMPGLRQACRASITPVCVDRWKRARAIRRAQGSTNPPRRIPTAPRMAGRNAQYVRVVGDGQEYTVEDAMNTVGFGKYHWFLVFFAGMAWMGDAMEVMILSYLGPAVRNSPRNLPFCRSSLHYEML